MAEKWVSLDVWYNVGDSHCHFENIRFEGAIERAKTMYESSYVSAVKLWDKNETYLYLEK
jgi:hypothetical protein